MKKGFKAENMQTWKMHWDRQLYKALEHQYQMGLEALNENLPEIKVELVFRSVHVGMNDLYTVHTCMRYFCDINI